MLEIAISSLIRLQPHELVEESHVVARETMKIIEVSVKEHKAIMVSLDQWREDG